MAFTYEELVKNDKDRACEAKYKSVRMGLKLSMAKYIQEANGGALEKAINSFVGIDPNDKSKPEEEKKKSILDELLEISKLMDEVFSKIGDAEEALLANKLSSVSSIYMERVSEKCKDVKLNSFPFHKEKFSMDVSEEQECKNIVPRAAFRSVKLFLDRYYFVYRQCSVNPKARMVFAKLSEFREKLQHFEYCIGHYIGMLRGEYVKEIATFYKDTKKTLLRLRKLFEAIDASGFGALSKVLYGILLEQATRIYVKNNATVTVSANDIRKGSVIPIQSILEKYDKFMTPIRATVADYDSTKQGKQPQRPPVMENDKKAFWDIADQIAVFRDGMKSVVEEFQKGVSPSDDNFKFFIHTVQTVIIPYMNQTRGEINDTFAIGVKNLDTFFWKVTIKAIESGQENGETMDEIAGIAVLLKESDLKRPSKDATEASAGATAELAEDVGLDGAQA